MLDEYSMQKLKSFGHKMHPLWMAFLLTACGGGSSKTTGDGGTPTEPGIPTSPGGLSGRVVDGYVANARVFLDANNNKLFDAVEEYSITNSEGVFSGLNEASTHTLVVDNYAGTARDTSTGFGLGFTMAAPTGYEVITPVTTLVVGLMERGKTQADSEAIVTSTLGLTADFDLSSFDPFENLLTESAASGERSSAEAYQLAAMKVANIMLVRDGDYTNTVDRDFQSFLDKFASAIEQKYNSGETFNFSDVSDLRLVVNEISNKQVIELANSNSATSYRDLLDDQLISLSGTSDGSIDVQSGATEQLVAVEIDGTFNAADGYSLTITGEDGSVVSADVVSFGNNIAVFRFTKAQLDELGSGSISVSVKNISTDEILTPITQIEAIQPATTTSTGGGTGSDTPAVVVSDDGIVADGYISGARVFRDENENETYDIGETFVLTDASGAFTGLGGSADKPIAADGNGGTAIDTSTGVTFTAVLSAPAGSKVVNPITTVVNELMQDTDPATIASITNSDGKIDPKLASDKVAKAFGLSSTDSFAIDLTKYDPIANKVYVEEGAPAQTVSANLATVTQGVAAFIANIVVSGANEQGGSADDLLAAKKSIIGNIKEVVKAKASSDTAFKFDDQNDILSALGSDFAASSPALEKLKTSYAGFEPAVLQADNSTLTADQKAKLGSFDGDNLIAKQLLSQSEFGDGILTTAEASNGATLVVGPTSTAQSASVTVKITNDDRNVSVFKQVEFSNAKYASVSLTADDLTKLGGGTISVEVKDAASLTSANWASTSANRIYDNFSGKAYFHKDITPVLEFGDKVFKTIANDKVTLNKSDTTSLEVRGTLEIDLGGASLPTGVTLKNLVGGLGAVDTDAGRKVNIEVLDASGKLAFLAEGTVAPVTGATNPTSATGSGTFKWSATIDGNDTSAHDDAVTFAALDDGQYSVRVSFTDAYGTVSSASGATFSNLTIDREIPTVSVSASDVVVNVVDGSTTFKVAFSKAISLENIDYTLIKLADGGEKTLADAITDGDAAALLSSDGKTLSVTYTPAAASAGTVDLKVLQSAITDASGNANGADVSTASTVNSVSYDLVAPTLPEANIKLYAAGDDTKASVAKVFDGNRTDLKVEFKFTEDVKNFTLDDVTITSISGSDALTLSTLTPSAGSATVYTADVVGLDQAEGNFKISVASGSYSDAVGNVGSAGASATLTIDTRAPKPFQVFMDKTALAKDDVTKIVDKTTYENGDTLVINVVFDQLLNSTVDTANGTPTILLDIGGASRAATLSSVSGSTAKFTYTVTNSDNGAGSGIGVGSKIVLTDGSGNLIQSGGSAKLADNILAADDSNGAVDENTASVDIGAVSQPINLGNKRVDGGDAGASVDGYIDGGIIYADNDLSSSLTSGDALAQANATGGFIIYGASGPLILEDGFDISTNKEFAVRYKAPYEAEAESYQVINPITTLVAYKIAAEKKTNADYDLASGEAAIHSAIGSPLSAANGLRQYNAYEEIAKSIDASGIKTDVVEATVDAALAYQQAAASVALVVDFLSTAAYHARADDVTTSIKDVSDAVFEAVTENLTTFMSAFVGQTLSPFYDGAQDVDLLANIGLWDGSGATIYDALNTIASSVTTKMDANLETPFGGVTNLLLDFPEALELLSASIVAINLSETNFVYPAPATADTDTLIEAAEAGITALTEIVQVQSLVQADILGDIAAYYAPGATEPTKPTNITVSGLLGEDEASGYLGQSVGTVVPIRYDVALAPGTAPTQFESDSDGIASEFNFLVTRAGSIKTTSTLDYAIEGNISAADIAGGQLSGQLVFDVNEKTKIVNVGLNNDTIREGDETITLVISDPTETSQIVQDRASATVRDDDPSTPEISLGRVSYASTEDGTVSIDDASVDYFDLDADFKLEWDEGAGTLSTKLTDGNAYTSGAYVSYFELQNGLLQNLEYLAENQPADGTSDFATLTITAVDDKDSIARSASESFDITFDISRTPKIDLGLGISYDSATSYAGVATRVSGITISDTDSEFVSVNVSADLVGKIDTTSTASFNLAQNAAGVVTFAGDKASVQDALDNLIFTAARAGDVKLTISIDDGDLAHSRGADGTLAQTTTNQDMSVTQDTAHTIAASSPILSQTFEPNLKVGADFWNAFTGLSVSDPDTQSLTLTLTSTDDNARFRLYDAENETAPIIRDAATSLQLAGTASNINTLLTYLQVELTSNAEGSVLATLSDGDADSTTDPAPLLAYVAMDNAVPNPGGDRTASSTVTEDAGSQAVIVEDILLYDADAFEDGTPLAPTQTKILGVVGGTVSRPDGSSVLDEDGVPAAITLESGTLNLNFNPDANFFGEGKIRYVVVDPQQPTFTSAVSEITVNVDGVNDKPAVKLSSAPVNFTQGQAPVNLFNNASVVDIDNALGYSSIKIEISGGSASDALITPTESFSLTPTVAGNTVTFAGVDGDGDPIYLSASEVSALLASIKYQNSENFFASTQRTINVTVTDDAGLESDAASVRLTLTDINDAPTLGGVTSQLQYEEGGSPLAISGFGSLSDPEGTAIRSVKIEFASGYSPGFDTLSYSGAAVSANFDEATGALTLEASDLATGLTAAEFNAALADVSFSNASDNPSVLVKKLVISATDVGGATGTSSPKEIVITPVNDAPSVVSVAGGIESLAAFGGLYIKSGSPVKVAPNLRVQDADSLSFTSAKVEITTVPGAEVMSNLSLSALGENLKSIYGLTITANDPDNATVLDISKSGATISKTVLESVLREVSYENDGTGLTGKVEDIKVTVVDAAGASSNVFTSLLNLLDTPPVEVHTVSGFDTSVETPSDYYIATQSASAVKELKLNVDVTDGVTTRLFEATQLTVDLSSSTIRTDAGRFVYDRAQTTEPTNKLSDAQHVDVSELAGKVTTTTNIIGSTAYNVIQGSDFIDFIDGLGGRDVVRAGGGDDTVILRMSQSDTGAVYDGGAGGGDTLALPNLVWNGAQTVKFAGTVDLNDTSVSFTSYGVTVSNFENIDGGSVTAGLTLKGNASANTLRGGSASDTIWIGGGGDVVAGGALVATKSKSSHTATDGQTSFNATYDLGYVEVYLDGVRLVTGEYTADNGTTVVLNEAASTGSTVDIIPIDDVFAVDLSSLPDSGSTIADLSQDDRIKLSLDGTSFLDFSKVNWIHAPEDIEAAKNDTFSADKLDAWIEQNASGYRLAVETAQDAYKYVSIGTELYGTKGKWAVSDGGTFMLKPTLNVAPEFKSTGPASTAANPLTLSKATGETVFAKSFTGGDLIAIREPADGDDGDKLTLTFTSVDGVTLKSNLDGTEGLDEIIEGDVFDNLTPSDVNSTLSDLVVEMSSRGRGDVEFTISDGFAPEISKTLFLQAPNTAPTVSTTFDSGNPPEAEIGESLSLSSAFLSASIGDIDAADSELLTATLKVTGGLATVPANYANYVTVNGGTVRVAYDGATDLAGKTWPQVLAEAVEAISYSRATLGDVDVKLSVTDGLRATTTAANDIKFTFSAKDLPAPTLILSSRGEAGASSEINATQYDTGKVRVNVTDVGAKPGDKVVFKTTVGGTPQADFAVTIPASASNPEAVANFVEATLPNLAGANVTGGVFSVTAVLVVGITEITPKGTPTPATFTLDTTRPDAPVIKELSDANGPTEVVTNTSVTKLLVSDPGKDAGVLSHALVKLHGVSGTEWYDFSGSFDIKSLLQGDGAYLDEIAVTSSKKENPDTSVDYELTVSSQLEDGIYAVIARDSVENVSAWDVSGFSLDALAPELFVIDRTLDGSNIGFRLLNAGAQAGDDYELFKLSAEQSKAVEFAILPNEIGTDLPTDIAGVKLEVWSGPQSGAADIVAEFERDFAATSAHWSKVDPQAAHSSVSAKSAETLPVFELDFAVGLTAEADQVSVKITAEDRAGNTFEVTVPSDQIQIDATADVDGPEGLLRTTVADDIFTGISATESSTFSAKVEGLDTDISARTTYLLTDAQFAANFKLAKDATTQSITATDGQTEFVFNAFDAAYVEITLGDTVLTSSDYTVAADGKTVTLNAGAAADQVISQTAKAGGQFFGDLAALAPDAGAFFEADGSGHLQFNSGAVYLDISGAFLESLYLTGNPASKAPTSGVGSKFSDWILIGTSGGKAQYITFNEYLSYDPETTDLATLDVYLSEYVVDTALDDFGRPALETISEIDLSPIFPSFGSDEHMVVLTEVSDVAGNVAFGDNIFNQNLDAAVTPSEVLLLDNTPPDAPSFIVERSDGGIDFWEAQQTLRATIQTTGLGDVLEISSVQFDGSDVNYDVSQEFFTFDVPKDLASNATYDLTANFVDSSGNEKSYTTSVELTRDATAEFAVVPTVFSSGDDYLAVFDIYINTELSNFASAQSIDLYVSTPSTQFEYVSAARGPGLEEMQFVINDANPEKVYFSAIAQDTFNSGSGINDEPLLSLTMRYNGATYDRAAVNDTLGLQSILVDEQQVSDFIYTLDFTDLIVLSGDV